MKSHLSPIPALPAYLRGTRAAACAAGLMVLSLRCLEEPALAEGGQDSIDNVALVGCGGM